MTSIKFIKSTDKDYQLVKDIRTCVFTNEQGADAAGEFDSLDAFADFALLLEGERAVGTARVVRLDKGFKIGRIAILKDCRGKGYGALVVKAVCQKATENGANKIFVDAQNYAVPFYEKLGFRVIGDEITDRGLPHIPMMYDGGNYGKKE